MADSHDGPHRVERELRDLEETSVRTRESNDGYLQDSLNREQGNRNRTSWD